MKTAVGHVRVPKRLVLLMSAMAKVFVGEVVEESAWHVGRVLFQLEKRNGNDLPGGREGGTAFRKVLGSNACWDRKSFVCVLNCTQRALQDYICPLEVLQYFCHLCQLAVLGLATECAPLVVLGSRLSVARVCMC